MNMEGCGIAPAAMLPTTHIVASEASNHKAAHEEASEFQTVVTYRNEQKPYRVKASGGRGVSHSNRATVTFRRAAG